MRLSLSLSCSLFLSGEAVSALRHSITIDSGVKKFNFFLANCDDDPFAVWASNEEMAENAVTVAVAFAVVVAVVVVVVQ